MASPPASSTATRARVRAAVHWTISRRVGCACWSPRTSPPAASTSLTCRWSSTSNCRSCAEDYVHRVGRTGRAGQAGRAVSLVSASESGLLRQIQQVVAAPLERVATPIPNATEAHETIEQAGPDPRGSWLPAGARHLVRESRSAVQRRKTPPRGSSPGRRRSIVSRVTAAANSRRAPVARDHRTGLESMDFRPVFHWPIGHD